MRLLHFDGGGRSVGAGRVESRLAPRSAFVCALVSALFATLPAPAAAQGALGDGVLRISGTTLRVSPESQTVPFDTPTIVNTELVGFDAEGGALPGDLRVVGELTGPEIDGVLELSTLPNEPFRIPRLSVKGQYRLDNIRLEQGGEHLAFAEPRSAAILVTQILVTRVSSRPLTLEEIRSRGIVVDGASTRAYNFTFGFGVEGQTVDYNVPVLYWYEREHGGQPRVEFLPGSGGSRFTPPRMAPFVLKLKPRPGAPQSGGCADPSGCQQEEDPPLPGVILFPTDLTLLNQFFSVVLFATNGAPEGDVLTIRDLTAKIHLPSGLAAARTEPPTTLGTPVPMRVPGPDGELGTADDLTFLIAQATAQAEFLVEGRREGTHIVDFELEGVLEGLPTGIRRISGTARGAVVVRDPTLGVTVSHPDVVLADEEYTMEVTVANNGITPANLVRLALPPSQLAGVQVVGESSRTIESLLPGEAELVEFRLRPLLTGRVIASFVRADNHIEPTFNLKVGVGEGGIPLSPTEIVLPREVESLPTQVRRHGLGLIGLGFSLATAPASLRAGRPQVSREEIDQRVFELAQAGRYIAMGESPFDAAAELAVSWSGAPDGQWEWDELRRITRRGALFGDAIGQTLSEEAASSSVTSAFERFAETTAAQGRLALVAADGEGSYLEIESRASGKRLHGPGTAADRLRELPFADLYDLGTGELALLAAPETPGYRVTLRRRTAGVADLSVLAPTATGELEVWSWPSVGLSEVGRAVMEFAFAGAVPELAIDDDGDGAVDDLVPGAPSLLSPRPFRVVAAVQNARVDKTGHVVDVLFSAAVDFAALRPRDSSRFSLPGKVSDGGTQTSGEGLLEAFRPSRIVRVVFNNALSPYVEHTLEVRDVASAIGVLSSPESVDVVITATMPGTLVEGRLLDSYGQPIPFARVELAETDYSNLPMIEDPCIKHVTGAVLTDADGRFRFDYVRQTECGGAFELRGFEPGSGRAGRAFGKVRFIGQVVQLDIVLLGRGLIRGRVTYDDGTVPTELRVIASNPVFLEARRARVDANGNYDVGDVPVGPVTLSAQDGDGSFAYATVEIETAGDVVERDLVILRRGAEPTGSVRGRVFEPGGTVPVYNAYLALYVGGRLVDVRRSDLGGAFDFGTVPAGPAEIEAFDAESGRSGARAFFDVLPDQVAELTLLLRDERGMVEGYVYRRQLGGDAVPISGAVVYLSGQPFNTTTDGSGYYRLEGVVGGTATIVAADLATQTEVRETVLLSGDDFELRKDLYFPVTGVESGLAGEFLDRDGTPIANAVVHLAIGDVNWIHETYTDTAGRFTIPGLAPGTYSVHAFRGADGGSASASIQFPGHTPFVTIRVRKGGLHGVVRAAQEAGEPVGVRSIVRYRTTVVRFGLVGLDTQSHDLETDAAGNWALPNVLAGPYVVEVFNAFYGRKSFSGQIAADGETLQHDVLFELAATIEGVVFDHDGVTPAAGATVRLAHPAFSNYTVVSDAEGRFTFEGIPPDPDRGFAIRAHLEEAMVYRDAEIRAVARRHGELLEVSMTLPVQGSVQGRVETSAGAPVTGATLRLRGRDYPYQDMTVQSDSSGTFAFSNVLAGEVAIAAQTPSGLGGRTTTTISSEGEERVILVRIETVGAIVGRVVSPVDGSVAPNAQVQLVRGFSFFDAVTADEQGRFLFDALPMGNYSLRALDLRTGRSGRAGGMVLDYEGEVIERDILLEARGSVRGQLFDPNGYVPVPGATIRLQSLGLVSFATFATTDFEGEFEFDGIPQGRFLLSTLEPGGYRRASGAGEIVQEDEIVVVDLVLQESGLVSGTVLEPVAGSTTPFGGPTSVALYQGGRLVGGSLSNPFLIGGVLADQTFRLNAYESGGPRRGSATGVVSDQGQEVTVDVRLWPIGSVRVGVVDGAGQPVPGAALKLTASGPYGTQRFNANSDESGVATFAQVGSGSLSASAVDPLTQLRGSATGALSLDGVEVALQITLEPSAELRGTVLLADGETPAAGAQVVVRVSSRTYYASTDESGLFDFEALPLGGFSFDLYENLGPGEWHGAGTLPSAGFVRDLGTIVLDAADPVVESLVPESGAVGVALAAPVVVTFSEPIATSYQNGWVELRRLGSSVVATTAAWSADRRVLTLTPNSPLASFTSYQVKVKTDIRDVAGRNLPALVQATFTTLDALPPQVLSTLPLQNALNVPVDVQFRVLFSEAVDLLSLSGSALQLTDLDDGVGVTTTFTLQPQNREVLITPVVDLVADHRHRLTVQGVRDVVGNVMPQPFVLEIETADVTPPDVSSILPAAGSAVTSGDSIEISAVVTDNQARGPVTFRLLGRSATVTPPAAGSVYRWTLTVPPVSSVTSASIEVEARDAAGNVSLASSALEIQPLLDPDYPDVAVACPSAGARLVPGTGLWINAEASDDQGLLSVEFFLGDSTVPVASLANPPFRYRLTAPSTATEGETLAVRVVATDYGLKSTEALLEVEIAEGAVIQGSRTITPGDTEFEGRTLAIAAGTVTIDGAHTFRDLLILDGATVNHREATPAADYRLELELTRDLFVSCEGKIDVTGQGYVGGPRHSGRARGYGNRVDEGANYLTGASHGGRGGLYDGSSRIYGSLFDPRWPGGGAGGNSSAAGSDGGGVIRIAAAGAAIVDGVVRANGGSNLAPGAAGGSIRLDAESVAGAGVIEANGGDGPGYVGSGGACGGGGRVAVYADGIASPIVSRIQAWGGERSYAGAAEQGAAGTVFLKRASDPRGELIIDNRGLVSSHWTELPSAGEGRIDAVSIDSVTDFEASFRDSIAGVELYFEGDDSATWPVLSHEHEGTTLSLDVSTLPLAAQVGDTYEGLSRFDRVTVRGRAQARTVDDVVLSEAASVEPGSIWAPSYGAPALLIPDIELLEGTGGETVVRFRVALSRAAEENARFTWLAVGESATEGEDFVAASGTVSIALGQVSARFELRLVSDAVVEADESIRIELSDLVGLTAPADDPRVLVRDDDGSAHCAEPELVRNGGAEEEPFGGAIPHWTIEANVRWSTSAGLAPEGGRYFDPRETFACPAKLRQDIDVSGFGAAIDAELVRFALSGYVLSLPGSPPDSAEIEVEFRDAANATILGTWASEQRTSVSSWTRVTELLEPPVGTRKLRLRLVARGPLCGGRLFRVFFDALSIAPFDFASIGVGDASAVEQTGGASALEFPVTYSCGRGAGASVQGATVSGTAVAGSDFANVGESLVFAVGETSKTVSVPIVADAIDEANESMTLELGSAVGAFLHRGIGIGTIVDDDVATLSISDLTLAEGSGATAPIDVTISLSTPSAQTVTVVAATANGTATAPGDYSATSASRTFLPGETTKSLSIPIVRDAIDEADESFLVRLSSPVGATIADPEATVTLLDDDENLLTVADVSVPEGDVAPVQATVVVQLSSPALAPVEVHYQTEDLSALAGVDYVAVAGVATIAAGQSALAIAIDVLPESDVELAETFRFLVTQADGATLSDPEATITLLDDDLTAAIADLELPETDFGTSTWDFAVTLNAPAPGPVALAWATAELPNGSSGAARAPGDYTASSGTLNLPTGATGGVVPVTVRGDTADELLERFFVRLSNPSNVRIVDAEAEGRIRDNEPPSLLITQPPTVGQIFDANSPITIAASATDVAGIESVTFTLDGVSFVDTSAPYEWVTTTPSPQVLTQYPIVVDARDNLGNVRSSQKPIRVRAVPIPPVLETGLVTLGLDFFGAAAIGAPGAVVDPTDAPIWIEARNLTTQVTEGVVVEIDGSFSVPLFGMNGESFELQAFDSIGLASGTMVVGPVAGDEGRVATLEFGSRLAASAGSRLAVCDCSYVPPSPPQNVLESDGAGPLGSDRSPTTFGGGWEEGQVDLRVFDVSSPLDPVHESRLRFELDGYWTDGCSEGAEACRSHCATAVEVQPCWDNCAAGCAPGDWNCNQSCWLGCGGDLIQACQATCDGSEPLCGELGCAGAAANCTDECLQTGGAAECSGACAAWSAVCAAAPPAPACLVGPQACFESCSGIGLSEPCYGDCMASCPPEDYECQDGCYWTCGGSAMETCGEHCRAGWDSENEDLCDAEVSCEEAATACGLSCQAAGGDPACTTACAAFTAACATGGPPLPVVYRYPFTGFDFAPGVAAMTQGPMLRIVDLRDPAHPQLVDARQSLRLIPDPLAQGDELVGVRLVGGLAFALQRLAPNRLFVVDVADPSQPRPIGETSLGLGTVDRFEVSGGQLHVTYRVTTAVRYRLFSLGQDGAAVPLVTSGSVDGSNGGTIALTVVDEVAAMLRSSDVWEAEALTFHSGDVASAPFRSTQLTDQSCFAGDLAEIGDRIAIVCGDDRFATATLDTTLGAHDLELDRWLEWPSSYGSATRLLTASGRVWAFPGGVGFASATVRPWLAEAEVTIEVTGAGATITGAAGAASGATLVRGWTEIDYFEVPVAADGSFVLSLTGEMRGELVHLQAALADGHGGNRLRLRIPLGNAAGSLPLSDVGGARRIAREGDVVAIVPGLEEESGAARVRIVSTASGLDLLAEVEVDGPVSDAVLLDGVLYVGGAGLAVFDLADPASPVAAPVVDLFAGQPVLALVSDGARLWALGAEGGSQRLLPVDVASPLAPAALPAESLLVPSVAEPRLFVLDGDLFRLGVARIERFELPAASPPALIASGSPAGVTLADLDALGGELWVAARGQGARSLDESGGLFTLGAAPSPARGAAGLFVMEEVGGPRLWRAAGLPGAARDDLPRQAPSDCELHDVVVFENDLLLLTGCALEREELP